MSNIVSSKTVHPDVKGRIALGVLAKGVSSFHITAEKNGRIILEPFVEIPAHEQWLFKNKPASKQIQKGLSDAAAGRISSRGDFSKFADAEID